MHPDTVFVLIPIALFASLAYAIKSVADARARAKLATSNGSQEFIRTILLSEEENRRMAGLRWGIVLTCLAGGLAIIELGGWEDLSPGVFAVLIGATGAGNLAFFAAAHAIRQRTRAERHSSL